ncbi:MAG TPA: GNAT family N-acetyltransferase [Gemmatimonadaceae bacterium]|jgi:GNAT superfamily N-acetyltransferase|nr:GNAT family N-acetyltransferase [Gemmatimonadaceae bacterium]
MSVTDLALSQRLERAEAKASAAYIESRARIAPSLGAEWRDVSGTYAMFDGVGSPLSQTFGFGLFAPPAADDLTTIERFFLERGAQVFHEVSPLVDPAVLGLLGDRGYRPVELTSVMHMSLAEPTMGSWRSHSPAPPLDVVHVEPGEEDVWAETAARGWSETPELAAFIREFGEVSARAAGTMCFLARWDAEPIAAAALAIHDGVALLAGASTDPRFRGRGAQAALLGARLRYAMESGCDLAMMGAQPGSASQRNGERQGFRIAYTRIKWGSEHHRAG